MLPALLSFQDPRMVTSFPDPPPPTLPEGVSYLGQELGTEPLGCPLCALLPEWLLKCPPLLTATLQQLSHFLTRSAFLPGVNPLSTPSSLERGAQEAGRIPSPSCPPQLAEWSSRTLFLSAARLRPSSCYLDGRRAPSLPARLSLRAAHIPCKCLWFRLVCLEKSWSSFTPGFGYHLLLEAFPDWLVQRWSKLGLRLRK